MTTGAYALSTFKAELDAALIQLGVQLGIEDHHPAYNRVREAGDALFQAAIRQKFGLLAKPDDYVTMLSKARESSLHDDDKDFPR